MIEIENDSNVKKWIQEEMKIQDSGFYLEDLDIIRRRY